ncbi:MAG: hypothetical protein ACD_62C00544G0009 [uncultured bacterium]|nr:MAG: hypothetical protein ACD_62C00544G0009 [uncultured bacterium]HLD46049.1 KOW motif domain-containing protein [bacterium]
MKLGIKIGDVVEVIKGKFSGQKSKIVSIDKKNDRVVLENLKKQKTKTKSLHGSFHVLSLKLVKAEQPKTEEPKAEEKKEAVVAAS